MCERPVKANKLVLYIGKGKRQGYCRAKQEGVAGSETKYFMDLWKIERQNAITGWNMSVFL